MIRIAYVLVLCACGSQWKQQTPSTVEPESDSQIEHEQPVQTVWTATQPNSQQRCPPRPSTGVTIEVVNGTDKPHDLCRAAERAFAKLQNPGDKLEVTFVLKDVIEDNAPDIKCKAALVVARDGNVVKDAKWGELTRAASMQRADIANSVRACIDANFAQLVTRNFPVLIAPSTSP